MKQPNPLKPDFHVGSRKPFVEEAPVLDAVKRAQEDMFQGVRHVQGEALFRVTSHVAAMATAIPQAVDIIRCAPGVAVANGATARVLTSAANADHGARVRSAIANAQDSRIAESLRRLGVLG